MYERHAPAACARAHERVGGGRAGGVGRREEGGELEVGEGVGCGGVGESVGRDGDVVAGEAAGRRREEDHVLVRGSYGGWGRDGGGGRLNGSGVGEVDVVRALEERKKERKKEGKKQNKTKQNKDRNGERGRW